MTTTALDMDLVERFAGQVFGYYTGGLTAYMEPKVSSNLEDNIGHSFAPLLYATSTLHCLTVSLAEDGAGLGTAFGEQKAIELLTEAGFTGITVGPAPGDPLGGVFVGTKPAA